MTNELELKWSRMQRAMREMNADGCLLHMNMNLYYVSGQVFNGYFYLPLEGEPHCFLKRKTFISIPYVHEIRKPEQMPISPSTITCWACPLMSAARPVLSRRRLRSLWPMWISPLLPAQIWHLPAMASIPRSPSWQMPAVSMPWRPPSPKSA